MTGCNLPAHLTKMPLTSQYCFTHSSGRDVFLFTLSNKNGAEALLSNYGAIIAAFKIKRRDGSVNDIVLGFDNVKDYVAEDYLHQYPWFGCAVGRYANRVSGAAFVIDGKKYNLTENVPGYQLHGGKEGFDKKVWRVVSFDEQKPTSLTLAYTSPDGEEGYPGNLDASVRFDLTDNDELIYEYIASCDKATAVNLTHHGYFNLNNGSGTIDDHELKIYSDVILEQTPDLIPTGKKIPVKNTAYDFTKFRRIGDGLKIAREYDKSFIVAPDGNSNLRLMAEARSVLSETTLQVYSTDPVVHFYSGKGIPSIRGKGGITYGPFSGFCLETQIHPNAINTPGFPNTILRPGETYFQKNMFRVIG